MDSAVFKYKHHYQQQQQQQQQHEQKQQQPQHQQLFNNIGGNSNSNNDSYYNHHNNNNKQNSIFILNTTTNSILPNNNSKLFYSDLNENNVVASSSSLSTTSYAHNNTADASSSSSMWLSASSTMCSPAAHAIQKLFNCSSTSLKSNQGNYKGIDTKSYKTKSELLKKKNKIWKYLEGEEEEQRGIENETKEKLKEMKKKSFKHNKTKYWLKSSNESDNQNNQDLAELLEYSCSLCDNCQCIDCQIAYFDCDNSDDSNSEYSFHLSAYEEDDDNDEEHGRDNKMELIATAEQLNKNMADNNCQDMVSELQDQLEPKSIANCNINESCQQCLLARASNQQ